MADEQRRGTWVETLLGFLIILVVIAVIVYVSHGAYVKLLKPAPSVVSLSAYFVDDAGNPTYTPDSPNYAQSHIKIKGDVYQGAQPVKSGIVRVAITRGNGSFQQSVAVPLKDGHFETEDPVFRSIHPGDAVSVTADVSAAGLSETAVIYLNSESPVNKLWIEIALWGVVVVLGVVFFYAFTGKKTAFKNQVAIIFSYLIIGLFLAVPIVAPVLLLRTFPEAVEAMIGEPAGLVNTHTPNQQDDETQWALNIGGYSHIKSANPADTTSIKPASADKSATTTVNTNTTATDVSGTQGGAPDATNPSVTAGTNQSSASPSQTSGTDSSRQPGQATKTSDGATTPAAEATTSPRSSSGALNPPIVQVQGGLVIPLYVIILSVIGGAINMTRKVPGFQREGEESDVSPRRPISKLGTLVIGLVTQRRETEPAVAPTPQAAPEAPEAQPAPVAAADQPAPQADQKDKPEPSLQDQANAIDNALDPLVIAQIKRNSDTETTVTKIRTLVLQMRDLYSKKTDEQLLGFNSYDDWFASHPRLREVLRGSWRVELLNQYMYLISAPFLAVVTYYILDLLGLSKQGVVVVLSFSVGLISEKIVSWILGIATGYLRSDTSGKPAKAS